MEDEDALGNTVFKYGDHKGRTWRQAIDIDPQYINKCRLTPEARKPAYVRAFLAWVDENPLPPPPGGTAPKVRTRAGGVEKKEHKCAPECTRFTRHGTNAFASVKTCLDSSNSSR